jgi:hypothetical protein
MKSQLQRILGPTDRFSSAQKRNVRFLEGGTQVLDQRNRPESSFRMVAKAYQLPHRGFPYQVNDASQFRMPILFVPDLGKLNPSAEVIDYFLIVLNWPLL